MANKRVKPEEIVSKLRQVEVLSGQSKCYWRTRSPTLFKVDCGLSSDVSVAPQNDFCSALTSIVARNLRSKLQPQEDCMTTIAQIDQLITSLQGMKASFAQSSTTLDGGDFNSVFASALSDA